MAIELITQYVDGVDEIFKQESKKSLLTNQDYSWKNAHTIRIYKIGVPTMNDYDRDGSKDMRNRFGATQNLTADTQSKTLSKDRSFTFVIDKMDNDETGQALAGATALARTIREVVIPEVDAWTYSQMIEGAGHKADAVELTPENIYGEIIKATTALDDSEVPETGRVLLVTPKTYQVMKKSKEIILSSDIGEDMRLKGVISNLDGMNIVKVASQRLPSKFGFMVAHPSATVAPTKLEDYRTHQDPPGISGQLIEGRIVYDAFVLDNKKKGIYYQATV